MKKTKELVRIYTGPEVTATLLKARLMKIGIHTLTKNDYSGAYMGVTQPSTDLWINENDLEKARPLLDDFVKISGNDDKI